ncbi:hypothetical protein ABK040_006171 [Willaertia magna]
MSGSNIEEEGEEALNNESLVNSEEDLLVLLKFIVDYHCEEVGCSSVLVDKKLLNETDESTTVASTSQNVQSNCNFGGTCSLEVCNAATQASEENQGGNHTTNENQDHSVEDICTDNNSSGSDNYIYKRMVSRHSPHKVHGKYCQIRKGLRKFKNFENNYFVFQLNNNKNNCHSKEQLQQQKQQQQMQSQPQQLSCEKYKECNCQFVNNNKDNNSLSINETFSSLNKIKKQNKQQQKRNKNLNYLINVEGKEDHLITLEDTKNPLQHSQQHVTINNESIVFLSNPQQQQQLEMLLNNENNNNNLKEEEMNDEKEVREEEMDDENVHLFETIPSLEEYLKIENEFIDEINHFQ